MLLAASCALSIQSNDFRGIYALTSAHQTYISSGYLSQNISNNTFTNLNVNTTGDITFISNNVTVPATGNQDVNSNSIVGTFVRNSASAVVLWLCLPVQQLRQ
jgi:dTDP-glucose pyrophosphorylase